MAQLTVHGNWKSIFAMGSMLMFFGILLYALVAGVSVGIWPYLAVLLTLVFGFLSREDHIAVVGITGFFALIILDILLRVGVLAFNTCADFSVITGC